nr:PREDICTED: alpha-glucosidase-like [Bemisia tabaci]
MSTSYLIILTGIIEKLDYIKELGVDAIWIQPVYRSPMVDMGYDPLTMREIDPIFGTLEDMKNLIRASHDRDLKVVMDIVVNHLSDQSDWFKRSVNREDPFTDYFIWHDGKRINDTHVVEPNNWVSLFSRRESAWAWNENRQQYYFYQFSEQQPDLNYHNPKVQEEMDVSRAIPPILFHFL